MPPVTIFIRLYNLLYDDEFVFLCSFFVFFCSRLCGERRGCRESGIVRIHVEERERENVCACLVICLIFVFKMERYKSV